MREKTLIFIIAGAVAVVVVLFVLSLVLNRNENKTSIITPAPSGGLSVVSSSIEDGQLNVPLNPQITVTFSREVNSSLISFNILPTPNYNFEIEGNRLVISPTESLLPSTLYSVSISSMATSSLLTSFSFTTLGPTPTLLPDTRPSGEPEKTDAILIQTRPDVYLSNKLPYEDENFSASYAFVTTPPSHFAFTVTNKGNSQDVRTSFLNWLKNLGLNDSQIATLDISYN